MKLGLDEIDGAVRFSFSNENTIEELDKVVEVLKNSVAQIRKMKK